MGNELNRLYEAARRREGFVDLMRDPGFKAVLADRGNKSLLIRMLNCILPQDARIRDIIQYRDREQSVDYAGAKRTFLDLVCVGDTGDTFNVEVQQEVDDCFFQRCVYYGCGLYHEELSEGDYYDALKPVYVIAFLGENFPHRDEALWDTENVISRYRLMEERTGEFAPSTLFVIFAELKRFTKTLEECASGQDRLLFWFRNGWRYDSLPEEFTGDGFIRELADACRVAGFPKEKYNEYVSKMKNERDLLYRIKLTREKGFEDGLEKGREEGRVEGEEKGRSDEKMSIARNMLKDGVPEDAVSKYTGLSAEEIKDLL